MSGILLALGAAAAATPPPAPGLAVAPAPNPTKGFYQIGIDAVITDHCFANASGGAPPYSYLWEYVSGFTLYGITDVHQPEIWWSQAGPDFHQTVFRVTVTDSLSHSVQGLVTVQFNPPS